MKVKEPRICPECGEPIPATRHPLSVTCSDRCQHERMLRQKSGAVQGYKEARPDRKGRSGESAAPGTRPCAGGCGRRITDYRCPECWAKLRAANGCTARPEESGLEEHDSWLGL